VIGIIVGCANTEQQNDFSKQGSSLPYNLLANDLTDISAEIHNGGYSSAMTKHPTNSNQFYALTDRGPNANYTGSYGKGKIFPVASYTPRIRLFTIEATGSLISGLPITLRRWVGRAKHLIMQMVRQY